jgi:hypothetical protein
MISKLLILTVFSFGIFFQTLHGQISQASTTIGSGTNQIDLSVLVNSQTGIINFTITGPSTKWFGIGFSASSMSSGAYGILANVGGGNPQEYLIQGQTTPSLQANQNLLNISSTTTLGRKTYTFSRNTITGDANDFVFPSSPSNMNIIWAYGNSTSLAYHSSRGVVNLTFTNPCNFPITNMGSLNICTGDSTLIFGNYQSQSGNYYDTLISQFGCDSILSQQLIVNQSITYQLPDISICYGDSVSIFGNNQTSAGVFYDTIISQFGCDSILSQQLIVNQSITYQLPDISICYDDSVSIFGNYQNSAGVFHDTLISQFGCDSIIWVNLSVQPLIDTSVSNNDSILISNQVADSYQWIDCQTNQPIMGANQIGFTPSQTGNYSVEITVGNCTKVSNCHFVLINSVSVSEMPIIDLWPNPTSNQLNISSSANQISSIKIMDLQGKIVLESQISEKESRIDVSKWINGIYIIELSVENKARIYKKFIKN